MGSKPLATLARDDRLLQARKTGSCCILQAGPNGDNETGRGLYVKNGGDTVEEQCRGCISPPRAERRTGTEARRRGRGNFPWCGGESGSPLAGPGQPGGEDASCGARPSGRRSLLAGDPAATDGPGDIARGAMLMCVLPPLEGWDGYQHVAYVHSMHETGRRPASVRLWFRGRRSRAC